MGAFDSSGTPNRTPGDGMVLVPVERLREIEWVGVQGGIDDFCPACGAFENDRLPGEPKRGHKDGCWLAAEIKEVDDES